jgi:hypothetical protein
MSHHHADRKRKRQPDCKDDNPSHRNTQMLEPTLHVDDTNIKRLLFSAFDVTARHALRHPIGGLIAHNSVTPFSLRLP